MDSFEVRKRLNTYIMGLETSLEPNNNIRDPTVPGKTHEIPVRIYTPDAEAPLPLLIFIHGAGWVASNLDTHENICRTLASWVGCAVVSVDDTLAPGSKFPKALEEPYKVYRWVIRDHDQLHIDPERIAIGGDSAGGNIAAGDYLRSADAFAT